MKKMTTTEFKQYVVAEAKKFYQTEVLKEEKNRIEKELSILSEKKVNPWAVCHASTGPEKGKKFEKCVMDVKKKQGMDEDSSPSAGLTKKEKSNVVKKAKAGEDIGKKGKGFKNVEAKAKASGASDPEAVAGAAMWKNIPR